MKKVIPVLICLLLINSCGFETPESITIKGEPGLYVPLGSPFARLDENQRLESLLSPDNIKKEIEAAGKTLDAKLNIYEVSSEMVINTTPELGPAYKDVLTYLVEYQLADIPLNLEKYINQAMEDIDKQKEYTIPEIPGKTGAFPPGTYYYIDGNGDQHDNENDIGDNPFLRIPLDDMVKFVNWVRRDKGDSFGLAIPEIDKNQDLEDYLEIKIPALGIDEYIKGKKDSKDQLLYVETAEENGVRFEPREAFKNYNKELWVYVRISGVCTGTIEPAIVFDWKEAEIYTKDDGKFGDTYPIGNSLENLLGGSLSFKKALGYVYIYGLNSTNTINTNTIKMETTFGGKPNPPRELEFINDLPYTVDLQTNKVISNNVSNNFTPSSIIGDPPYIDLAPIFKSDDKNLKVDISFDKWSITNDGTYNAIIKCKLCVLIPLDLDVSEVVDPDNPDELPSVVDGIQINNYVPLDLGNMLTFGNGTDDLFGRTEGEDNIINSIKEIEITLKDIDITIIEKKKLAVLLENKGAYKLLNFNDSQPHFTLNKEFINTIFNPKFTVLLEKDINKTTGAYEKYGSFSIPRPDSAKAPKFNFNLDIKAVTALEYNFKL